VGSLKLLVTRTEIKRLRFDRFFTLKTTRQYQVLSKRFRIPGRRELKPVLMVIAL